MSLTSEREVDNTVSRGNPTIWVGAMFVGFCLILGAERVVIFVHGVIGVRPGPAGLDIWTAVVMIIGALLFLYSPVYVLMYGDGSEPDRK